MRVLVSLVGLLALAPVLEAQAQAPTAERLRRFLEGIRGATPVQCEMALSSINGWYGWRQIVPDRDPQAGPIVTWVENGFKEPGLVAPLGAALEDPDPCVRRMAARLLGRTRLPAARARLLQALGDANPETRRMGAIGLGVYGDRSVVPQLVRALNDREPQVRAAVAWAIGAVH
jgi:hypothetical protein